MPVYEYFCKKCNAIDEVVRSMAECTEPYYCPECKAMCKRKYTPPQTITQGEQIPYFHPAFGKVMTDNQAKAEAKARGFIEVGNDKQESISPPEKKSYDENDYFI